MANRKSALSGLGPTREQEAAGDYETVTLIEDGWTQPAVVRRNRTANGPIDHYHRRGTITARQHRAAVWYREQYEQSGLAPRVTADWSGAPKAAPGAWAGHAPRQLQAREAFWAARKCLMLAPALVRIFDAVVLHDVTIGELARGEATNRRATRNLQAEGRVSAFLQLGGELIANHIKC